MKFDLSQPIARQNALELLKALSDAKKYIEIKEAKQIRTLSQNRLYWLYMACIEAETGNCSEDLHEYFKMKFNGVEVVNVFGHEIYKGKTTTNRDTKEFTDYIEKIVRYCATELQIALPDPSDRYFEQFFEQYKHFIK